MEYIPLGDIRFMPKGSKKISHFFRFFSIFCLMLQRFVPYGGGGGYVKSVRKGRFRNVGGGGGGGHIF